MFGISPTRPLVQMASQLISLKPFGPLLEMMLLKPLRIFFETGLLLKELNAIILSLVPKKPNSSIMGDYRPIDCCNVLYKCITKIISSRLLPFLDSIISKN